MKTFLLALTTIIIASNIFAQSTLVKGDIAFVAINSDGSNDDFSFLLLTNIETGTEINFTDNGWTALGAFNSIYNESHITWTCTSDLNAGDIVNISTHNGVQLASASSGVITGEKMTVSVAGDQILAYQGEKIAPNFIAAISFNHNLNVAPGSNFDGDSNTNSTTAMPSGLTLGNEAIHIYEPSTLTESDNSIYNCDVTEGSKTELLAAINNINNWYFHNTNTFNQNPFPCSFTVDTPTDINDLFFNKIMIYPNPASYSFNLSIDTKEEVIAKLYSSVGVLIDVLMYQPNVDYENYSTDHLSAGIYYLKMIVNGTEISKKISIVK